ncbi:MAG: zf-HC2 domain-containing protein [Gemmatimonadales bacterium]|nr:zf-HC2 domain-containing protein [Gemmatimonadales bacterium]
MILTMSHLDPLQVAAFIDRTLDAVTRRAVEDHLASCAECRAELLEVGRVAGGPPAARRHAVRRLVPWLAAAAALLVVVQLRRPGAPVHREPAVRSAVAPGAIAPAGEVASLVPLEWSSVPGADRYRVALFERDGRLLWEETVLDTTAVLPAEIAARLAPGITYHWSVRARVGWERWTESGLTEFQLRARTTP